MSDSVRWTAMVLAAVALPLVIVSLIDPLEGGIPLLAAVMLTVIVRLMSRVLIPRLELGAVPRATRAGAHARAGRSRGEAMTRESPRSAHPAPGGVPSRSLATPTWPPAGAGGDRGLEALGELL